MRYTNLLDVAIKSTKNSFKIISDTKDELDFDERIAFVAIFERNKKATEQLVEKAGEHLKKDWWKNG